MNKNYLLAAALMIVAGLSVWLNASGIGDWLADCIGAAIWYLPYAAIVGAVHFARIGKARCRAQVA